MPVAIQQALKFGSEQLSKSSSGHSDTPELDAELILLFCLKTSRNILFTHPDQLLSTEQELQFKALLKRRFNGEPVAYLLGTQGFWDLNLLVASHTLIPRGDTESLIDWVLEQTLKPQSILDLGTGTGALALALAQEFPAANVIGVDVVEEAVQLAIKNKTLNKIENANFPIVCLKKLDLCSGNSDIEYSTLCAQCINILYISHSPVFTRFLLDNSANLCNAVEILRSNLLALSVNKIAPVPTPAKEPPITRELLKNCLRFILPP